MKDYIERTIKSALYSPKDSVSPWLGKITAFDSLPL